MPELPLVSPLDRALFLRAQPYFEGLEPSIVASIATHAVERFARAGEWLLRENEPVREVAFLAEGSVSIMRGDEVLNEIKAPGGVGLAAGLAGRRATPGIVATEPTVYLGVSFASFLQLLEDRYPLLLQIAQTLSRLAPSALARVERELPQASLGHPLDPVERIALARSAPLLGEINLTLLIEILRSAREEILEEGRFLWRRGDAARDLALVVEGEVEVGDSGHAIARQGDLLGLDDLLGAESVTRDVCATQSSRALVLSRQRFIDVVEDDFDAGMHLLRYLAARFIDRW
jgi:CRP-like cAMP-binding protein